MRGRSFSVAILVATCVALWGAIPAHGATLLYPNLKTLAPRDLRFDAADVDASEATVTHNVLRFSNTVWDAGPGRLEMRGLIDPKTKAGPATQRVYDDAGGFTDFGAGSFYYHPAHQHYHYDNWGRYELWTKAGYEAWLASGRTVGSPTVGGKTTSCMIDEEFIRNVPNQPYPPAYGTEGCFPDSQGRMLQGISPGWGDTYDYFRFEQWIDLGPAGSLANGEYVLRSVVDPTNKIYESPGKADVSRESAEDNEAITMFAVQNGALVDSNPPTGSVRINDIDASTASPNVTVKVLGRDDVSGVTQLRLSNDGSTWSAPQAYTGKESNTQTIAWSLTNPTFGGNNFDGTKTVYVQYKDASGKWSASESDTIVLDRGGGSSAYSNAVIADAPVAYWRLGEKSGTATAADAAGANPGTYRNGALLGQASLLPGDSANTAVRFDGANDYVGVPSSSALSPSGKVSLEAWIKPGALPTTGNFASIASKPESYSLQFNGPRLEFTIMQSRNRRRLQAPAGAIVAGQAYHVVGTYDGATQRLYVNGAEVASAPLSGAITTNANSLGLGSWDEGSEDFNGTVDEVAVYSGALSAARVAAHWQAGSGGAPPDTTVKDPSNLSATAVSETRIDLKWADNSDNEGEFLIQRDTSPSFTAPVVLSAWANSTSFSDTGLSPGTTYYYRVRARNATNSSNYSNTANATTLAPGPPPAGYQATVLADEPVGYWRLAETSGTTAADEKGANPGTYRNGALLGQPSLLPGDSFNASVRLDGTNDYVGVPSSASLSPSAQISVEAWILPASLPTSGNFASIASKPESYSLQFNGPRLEFTIMQSGARRRLQAPAGAIVAGQAYHVVGTYDGATQRLYVNGAEVASAPLSGAITTNANALGLGSWSEGAEAFNGTVDEVAVYSGALSAARVAAHWQAGSGGAPPPPPPPPTEYRSAVLADAPVAYWRLGEKSGTATAADAAGANPGTYRNGALLGQASLLPGDSANTAVRFDGANDYVGVPSSSALSPSGKVSLEAWIKPGALPTTGNFASIASKPESYSLQFNGPRLEFTIMQSRNRRRLQAPAGAIVAGQAYHVVGTYDGATQRLYVNGAEVASAPLSGAITTNANSLGLGSWDEGSEDFNGTVDEVAVYAGALSAARVAAHWQAGSGAGETVALSGLGFPVERKLVANASADPNSYSVTSPSTFSYYCHLHQLASRQGPAVSWRSLSS